MIGQLSVASYKQPVDADSHIRIDRLSPVGNPFRIGIDGTRDEVIEKYRLWMCENYDYKINYAFTHYIDHIIKCLRSGKSICLMCHCKPLPCHGDVLKLFIVAF